MPKPPNYEKIEQQMWRDNAQSIDEKSTYFKRKVSTYVWRFGYSVSAVKNKIRADKMFANWFTKEPRRQGIHEIIAGNWIAKLNMVKDFDKLPTLGNSAIYVNRDGILQTGRKSAGVKSLDFKWTTGSFACYATHKYTKEGGGNQDSQYKEVEETLRRFQNGSEDKKTVLLAIMDGPYYTSSKMQKLVSLTRKAEPFSYALTIGDVPKVLNQLNKKP